MPVRSSWIPIGPRRRPPAVAPRVTELLRRHALEAGVGGLRVRPLGESWLASGRLWSVDDDNGARSLVAKEGAYLAKEWAALKRLERLLAESPLSITVPSPILIDRDRKAMLMSRVAGTSSLWMLGFGPRALMRLNRAHAEEAFGACGAWLARFQRESVAGNGVVPEIADAQERLNAWPQRWRPLGRRLHTALRDYASGGAVTPLVMSHGDFAPRNVLAGADGVSVVDWEMVPGGLRSPTHDRHHFELALYRQRLWGRFIGGWQRMMDAFNDGYWGHNAPAISEEADRAARLATAVVVLDRQLKTQRRSPVRSLLVGRSWFIAQLARRLWSGPWS